MRKLTIIISAAVLLFACGRNKDEKTIGQDGNTKTEELKGTIKVDGSSTVYPITEAAAEEFRNIRPRVNVTIGVSGTGGGFKKFARGEVDLSNASRPIKSKEAELCKKNNINYEQIEIAYDGLAVIVNPENNWVKSFTTDELKKIWEPSAQGKIMKWNQINPNWPNEEIHLYGPGTASGTYDYFSEAVCGKKVGTRGDYTASEDDHVLVQGVAGDKYALGFFGLAYYAENKDKLSLVGIHNGEKVVKPTLETVSNGTYTHLSRPLFIYVSANAVKRPEVVEFVNYYIENAAELSKDVGYVPLPDSEINKQAGKFKTFVERNK